MKAITVRIVVSEINEEWTKEKIKQFLETYMLDADISTEETSGE